MKFIFETTKLVGEKMQPFVGAAVRGHAYTIAPDPPRRHNFPSDFVADSFPFPS